MTHNLIRGKFKTLAYAGIVLLVVLLFLGMADHHWTPATIRPYILSCIETFGIHRSLFATNWPVDALFSDYATLLSAYAAITADFTPAEKRALFSGNAETLYRI